MNGASSTNIKVLRLRLKDRHAKFLSDLERGTVHDRNVNAAKNILAAGRRRLAEGIPAPSRAREDVNLGRS